MERKVKVCHISSTHNSRDGRIFLKQCKSLANAGFEVYYLNRFETFEEDGVRVEGLLGKRSNGQEKSKIKLLKKAKNITNKLYEKAIELNCDIYQIHDPELLFCALKLKKKGKIVIFDSHENYPKQLGTKHNSAIVNIYKFIENYTLKRIDAAIFPCTINGEHIFEGKCENILILENFPMLEELYEKYQEGSDKIPNSICYVGGLTYNRGIKHLIKAAKQAKVTLLLGGKLSPPSFESEIRNMEGYQNVVEYGEVSRDKILDILSSSNIGISTILNKGQYNQADNLPTKVYEYMSMGLPVIMSDSEFSRKITLEYEFAVLVDPENIEEIAKTIAYLIENQQVAKKMGESGRKAIKEKFNWSIEEKKLIKLYRKFSEQLKENL